MQKELLEEENYEKLLNKYEREIDRFENEYRLFDGVSDDRKNIEPIRSKKVLEREEKEEARHTQPILKEYDESNHLKINFADYIKREEYAFDKHSHRLAFESQFYFDEWLKCVSVIEYKNKLQQRE